MRNFRLAAMAAAVKRRRPPRSHCARTTEAKKASKKLKDRERPQLPAANVAEFKKQG